MITALDQVTVEWLTHILSKDGALTGGAVASFKVEKSRGAWSSNASLSLRYATGSNGTMPPRLFLKMVDADLEDEFFGPSEVTYYTRNYIGVEGAPLLRCYDAGFSQELLRYHLLLDDVTGTWEQLWEDYRPCVPMGVYVATEWCRGGINAEWTEVWLTFLQRSLTACDDLACSELW